MFLATKLIAFICITKSLWTQCAMIFVKVNYIIWYPTRRTILHIVSHYIVPFKLGVSVYSLSSKMFYRQILWSLEATRLDDFIMIISLRNLANISAVCFGYQDACQVLESLKKSEIWKSRLQDSTTSCSPWMATINSTAQATSCHLDYGGPTSSMLYVFMEPEQDILSPIKTYRHTVHTIAS